MIKTTLNGYPIIYQSDNTYTLPSFTGTVQWNGTLKRFQVSTGSSWIDIDNNVQYNVDSRLYDVIQWAENKMIEEKELKENAVNNPALRDLLNQRTEIDEKIKIVETLIR